MYVWRLSKNSLSWIFYLQILIRPKGSRGVLLIFTRARGTPPSHTTHPDSLVIGSGSLAHHQYNVSPSSPTSLLEELACLLIVWINIKCKRIPFQWGFLSNTRKNVHARGLLALCSQKHPHPISRYGSAVVVDKCKVRSDSRLLGCWSGHHQIKSVTGKTA